jgi:hypothetical protein
MSSERLLKYYMEVLPPMFFMFYELIFNFRYNVIMVVVFYYSAYFKCFIWLYFYVSLVYIVCNYFLFCSFTLVT